MADGWVTEGKQPPKYGSDAYTWWSRGAADEVAVQREGLTDTARELLDCLTELARSRPDDGQVDLLETAVYVFVSGLSLRSRLRFAWRALRAGAPPQPSKAVRRG